MGYTVRKYSSAIEQQACECEPSIQNVKEGDLERGGGEQYIWKRKKWERLGKVKLIAEDKVHWHCFREVQCSKMSHRYFLHLT
jgi:hypothetical protein